MNKVGFFLELLERIRGEKPEFFKKYRFAILVGSAVLVVAFYALQFFELLNFGEHAELASYIFWTFIGIVTGAVTTASFATNKPELQDAKTKEGILKNSNINEFMEVNKKKG